MNAPNASTETADTAIDGVTLEILWNQLIAVMNEVDDAIVRTSFSTIVGESRDFGYILTDAAGRSLCQSTYSPPNFCVVLPITAKHLLARFPAETLRPGDVLATNDPWLGTGHLPDVVMISPVFHRDRIIGFVGSIAHVSDVGGHSGDIEALDVFQEGIRIPPCRLVREGRENADVFALIEANCRVPDLVLGDLRAMIGTHRLGARRLNDLLDQSGMPDLTPFAAEIHRRSETAMRDRISALGDGEYAFELEVDGYQERVRLRARITISGSEVTVDYTGTSPQVTGAAINCVFNTTYASTMFPFKCALAPEIPNNEALFRPIRVIAPEGCILNATFPAPVKTRAKLTNNLNQVIFGALWPIFGERAQAGAGSIWPFTLKGTEAPYGTFVVDMLPHGGRGATPGLDGMVPVAFPHNSVVTPCEVMEVKAPIMFVRKELRRDSAGAGRRRGGLGQTIAFRHTGTREMVLSIIPDKIFVPAPGLAGGRAGELGVVRLNGMPLTRFPPIAFRPDDLLELDLPGGAGFGDPAQRDPASVAQDIRLGFLTEEAAARDYGATV